MTTTVEQQIATIRATTPNSTVGTHRKGTLCLFVFPSDGALAAKDGFTKTSSEVTSLFYVHQKKRNGDVTVELADGTLMDISGDTKVFEIPSKTSRELRLAMAAYKEEIEKKDNIKLLPEIKELFDFLKVGYAIKAVPQKWEFYLEVSESTWDYNSPNFYTYEGEYSVNSEPWRLQSVLEHLRNEKKEILEEQARRETAVKQWEGLPEDVKQVVANARKYGLT